MLSRIFPLIPILSVCASTCYYPDGISTDVSHVPCNGTISASACCNPLDSCTTSGLCLGAAGYVYMGGCTDFRFTSENCPKFCLTDPILKTPYSDFANLYHCGTPGLPAGAACCGSYSGQECCNTTFGFPATGIAFKPGYDLTITRGSTTGAAVGAGIGVPLGLLVVGFLSFLLWKEKRRGGVVFKIGGKQWPRNFDSKLNGAEFHSNLTDRITMADSQRPFELQPSREIRGPMVHSQSPSELGPSNMTGRFELETSLV